MAERLEHVWERVDPVGSAAPVVFDSPHSGRENPPDFDFAPPPHVIDQTADTDVDQLIDHAPDYGIPILKALFPRAYIDPNRSPEDIDLLLLDDGWPHAINPTDKSYGGMGLVRRLCKPGMPMYDRRLHAEEIRRRIDCFYRPYHTELQRLLDGTHRAFGGVWHLNCHSMPSVGAAISLSGSWQRADFVLGDQDGTTSEPGFRDLVHSVLSRLGYSVRINDPYKGVELVRRYADPARNRHSLQLEINRRLYMNEETLVHTSGFPRLQHHLALLAGEVSAYARDRLMALAAD